MKKTEKMASQFLDQDVVQAGLLLGENQDTSQALERAQHRHRWYRIELGLGSTSGLSLAALKTHPGVGLLLPATFPMQGVFRHNP